MNRCVCQVRDNRLPRLRADGRKTTATVKPMELQVELTVGKLLQERSPPLLPLSSAIWHIPAVGGTNRDGVLRVDSAPTKGREGTSALLTDER
jgi:hypothetical protein